MASTPLEFSDLWEDSEYIRVCLPCVGADHPSQISNGPGLGGVGEVWTRTLPRPENTGDTNNSIQTCVVKSPSSSYEFHLGVPPFRDNKTRENDVLVTESCEALYRRILDIREGEMGSVRPRVVVTGKLGTGESLRLARGPPAMSHSCICSTGKMIFLRFPLAQLLSDRQVVVLYDNRDVWLFSRGTVYFRSAGNCLEGPPCYGDDPCYGDELYCPVWTVVDVEFDNYRPPIDGMTNV